MKKIPKKYVILLIILLLSGYLFYANYDKIFGPKKDLKDIKFGTLEAVVEKKTFDSEIEVTGSTKIKNEQKIKFNTSGKITEVNFEVGSQVKKGDRLVAIEATKAQSEIEKANLELEKAERNLEKVVKDLKDSKLKNAALDLKTAKLNIEKKEIDLSFMKQKVEQDLKTKQNELEIAKNQYIIDDAKLRKDLAISKFESKNNGNSLTEKNLSYEKQKRDYEDAKANFNTKVEKKINEYKLKLENAYFDLEKDVRDFKNYFDNLSEILGLKGSFRFQNYYSVKNNLNFSKIKDNYYKASEDFKKVEEAFKKIQGKNDSKNILETLKLSKSFYENSYQAFVYAEQGFIDSSKIEDSQDSQTFSEYQTKNSAGLSRSSSMRSSITGLIDELKNFESEEKIKKDLKDEIEKQGIAIKNMETEISKFQNESDFSNGTLDASQKNILINLKELKTTLDRKILEFEKYKKSLNDEYDQTLLSLEKDRLAYKASEREFEKLKNISKNDEYLTAEDAVKQSRLNVENAIKQLENYVITAPFDGVITKMDYKIGDRITENSEQSVSIVDPKIIEVIISINQSDIVKVRKNMEASITLESYPDKVLEGKLTEIDTTPLNDTETGLSKFAAKVLILDYGDLQLYTGMQANIKLKVSKIPESLVVPFSAVNTSEDGTKYVTVVKNGKKEKRTVEVGEPVGEYYQIISGLKEGEKVLEIDYDASKIKDENATGDLKVKDESTIISESVPL